MAKHRCDMPSVCDLLSECGFPIAMSGNALAYDFNLLSLQRTTLCSSWRHWGIKGVERWVKIGHDITSEYCFWHVVHTHILKERK